MEMTSGRIDHVVAHSGVRWWSRSGQLHDTSIGDVVPGDVRSHSLDLDPDEFRLRTSELPALHYTAAQLLLPRLLDTPGASYTVSTGGAGEQRSIISQVNAHAVWGLARGMREQYKHSQCRIIEVRASLTIGRPARERSADPR